MQATLAQRCDYLGRVPAKVKFVVEETLNDGSYLSWVAPSGKLRRKGYQRIQVRVIEYTIDSPDQTGVQPTYRLITSLLDIQQFPALLLAQEYHQRARSGKYN